MESYEENDLLQTSFKEEGQRKSEHGKLSITQLCADGVVVVVVVVTWKAADSVVTLRGSGQGMDHFFTTIWKREREHVRRTETRENKSLFSLTTTTK